MIKSILFAVKIAVSTMPETQYWRGLTGVMSSNTEFDDITPVNNIIFKKHFLIQDP